jgi:hypothetical protein
MQHFYVTCERVQIRWNIIYLKNWYVKFALLSVTYIYHKNIVVQHSIFVYS